MSTKYWLQNVWNRSLPIVNCAYYEWKCCILIMFEDYRNQEIKIQFPNRKNRGLHLRTNRISTVNVYRLLIEIRDRHSPNSTMRFWWQNRQKWRRLHENDSRYSWPQSFLFISHPPLLRIMHLPHIFVAKAALRLIRAHGILFHVSAVIGLVEYFIVIFMLDHEVHDLDNIIARFI
jgi:hypothetical protein